MNNSLIFLNDVCIQDLSKIKIASLSWQMKKQQAWLIIGANGSGKSDFFDALSGAKNFVQNADGKIIHSPFETSTEVVSLERAANLIEEERKLDESEYLDGIDIGRTGRRFIAEILGGPDAKHRNLPLPPIAQRLETLPEVKLCGIEKILDRGLKFMSTGEIRRTLLCRALLSQKKLLILSDPFAGLDAQSRTILMEFFETMVLRQKKSKSAFAQTSIIIAMDRYAEIPSAITNVLEFTDKAVSFCGTKEEYEKLILQRARKNSFEKEEQKKAFAKEFTSIQNETQKIAEEKYDEENSSEKIPLIKMKNVNVGWDGRLVLKDFNWSVYKGEHWLVRGPNGSGKTTLLELITGDNKQVYSNDIHLFGKKRGTGESIWDIKAKLGIVSYRMHVEYRMIGSTDLESVIISGFHDSIGLYTKKTDLEIQAARKWLKLAGFEGRESENFSDLSYGEQRAILIIRATVKNPEILILDEPCHALDENYRQKILHLLQMIAQTGSTTLLHVTHDPTEVLKAEKHILELLPDKTPMYKIHTQD
ncbi:ATP-binding cassette domain-containing protein [Treponema pectinovorum]|uniref:ATP-binding cassette domain-containing protein n=1 Tax=Treponema pectinovorum TaxID=164 RepID=UPI003D9396CA